MTGTAAVPSCSGVSRRLGEPLTGTAPVARAWILIEQPGPWGPRALIDSRLDPDVAYGLSARIAGHPVKGLLVRRPGRHARLDGPRRVWTAFTEPGRTWLERAEVADPRVLLDLDVEGLAAGDPPGLGVPDPEPLMLVCTNARRDRCCALEGRPLANTLAAALGDRVWETSHLGGHRFAPTALLLPLGLAYGRLDSAHALRVFTEAAAGRVVGDRLRGRTCWDAPAQVAVAEVRRVAGEWGADALDVTSWASRDGEPSVTVTVTARDGRRWTAVVKEAREQPPRPVSCGAEPQNPSVFQATEVVPDEGAYGGGVIHVVRVYDHVAARPGQVFLVDRMWPRGIGKDSLDLDGWARDAAPSPALRTWFGHRPDRWDEFRRRYHEELDAAPDSWEPLAAAAAQGDVTLLYAARDEAHNNAVALRDYLEVRRRGGRGRTGRHR